MRSNAGEDCIESQNAAECRGWIGLKGLQVRRHGITADRYTAWIGMLDNDTGRLREASHTRPCCIGIGHIVEGQFLSLKLGVAGERAILGTGISVKCRALVRIFSVTHPLHLVDLQGQNLRVGIGTSWIGRHTALTGLGIWRWRYGIQKVTDCAVVVRGVGKHLFGKSLPRWPAETHLVRIHLRQQQGIVTWINHDCNTVMIFGACPEHGGTPNVDIFYNVLVTRIGPGQSFTKRIKIDHKKVDGLKPGGLQGLKVIGAVPTCQEPAMHGRMECLDTAIEHLRKSCDVFNGGDVYSRLR